MKEIFLVLRSVPGPLRAVTRTPYTVHLPGEKILKYACKPGLSKPGRGGRAVAPPKKKQRFQAQGDKYH